MPDRKSNYVVTVLMTVFNGGGYLYKSILSVLGQSFKDFEFLIINDASTDDTLDILQSFQDPRIRIYNNPSNIGQTVSLNIGLGMAAGTYIARMDADDLAYPQWLQEQMSIIVRYPHCAVLSPQVVLIDSGDRIIKQLSIPLEKQNIILKSLFASPINHVGCLMFKETILQMGGYDERYKIAADYALWCKLIRQGHQICTHSKILVAVRTHAQSISVLEADKRVMGEMTEIIRENVLSLTRVSLKEPDVILLWRLIYTGNTLDLSQFLKGVRILESIYQSLNINGVDRPEMVQQFYRRQERIIFLKRNWNLVKDGDFINTRATAAAYIKWRGPWNIFVILWCLTFLGVSLKIMENLYAWIIAVRANRKATGMRANAK